MSWKYVQKETTFCCPWKYEEQEFLIRQISLWFLLLPISYHIIWYINIIDLVKDPSAICGLVVSPKRILQGQAGIMILCQAVSSHPFFNIITFFFYWVIPTSLKLNLQTEHIEDYKEHLHMHLIYPKQRISEISNYQIQTLISDQNV